MVSRLVDGVGRMTQEKIIKITELWQCLSDREKVLAYQHLLNVNLSNHKNMEAVMHIHQLSRDVLVQEIYKMDVEMDSPEFLEEQQLFLITNPYWLAIQSII